MMSLAPVFRKVRGVPTPYLLFVPIFIRRRDEESLIVVFAAT
jgi:hypothetical protein